jgi:hypothetical protein
MFGPASSRFDSKRRVFQPEPVSRPEARCTIPANSKPLKTHRLRRASFGIRPAVNWPCCIQKTNEFAKPADRKKLLVYSCGAFLRSWQHEIRNTRRSRRTTNSFATRARFAKRFLRKVVPQPNRQQPARTPGAPRKPPHTERGAQSAPGKAGNEKFEPEASSAAASPLRTFATICIPAGEKH